MQQLQHRDCYFFFVSQHVLQHNPTRLRGFPNQPSKRAQAKKKGCYLVKSLNRSHFNFILIFCIDLPRAAAAAAVVEVSSKSSLEEREDATSIRDGHFGFDGVGVGW